MKGPARSFSWVVLLAAVLLVDRAAGASEPTTADCLAATEVSIKLGNQHKLRAERSQLLVCAAASCPADIRKDCTGRVERLNAQIPTIIFGAKDAAGADLSAVKVTMDGEVLAERLEGVALPIDPGEHTFTFETSGQAQVRRTFLVEESQKERREVIRFGTSVQSGTAPDSPASGTAETSPPGADTSTPPLDGNATKRVAGWVVGGVGVAGVGLAVFFGVRSVLFSNKSTDEANTANQSPPPTNRASFVSAAQSDHSSAQSSQTAAIVSGAAGGAAVVVGVILLLTSGASAKPAATAGFVVAPTWERGGAGFNLWRSW